jgi:acyl-CoA synthetase (AMP-forming)/AMP-acid ligase II
MTERLPRYPDTVWSLIDRRARATPHSPMLVDDHGRCTTSGEYRQLCERVAAGLAQHHGIGEASVVSWQLPTSIEAFVLLGALARLGATQNPILPMLRQQEVSQITAQADTDLLIVPRRFRGFDHAEMASDLSRTGGFDVAVIEHDAVADGASTEAVLPVGDPAQLPRPPASDGVRWLYHSSGTTAAPKGVRHTDRSVMHGATGMIAVLGFDPSDVYPIAYPVTHIGGTTALTTQLMTGAQLALTDVFDPDRSPAFMSAVGASLLGSAVPFFHAYLDAQRNSATRLFPRLRACLNGGAPKPVSLCRAVRDELGGAGIIGSWGLTEFPIATFGSPFDDAETLARTEGRPVPSVEIRVVNKVGRDVPVGDEGELWLRGPQCSAGYVDTALNADAFVDAGWFRTGDLGVVGPQGHVEITGRIKDIIIRNAENLSALEIEQALGSHPDIADVAVVGLPDARTGERACAVIVLNAGRPAPTMADLTRHCARLGLARQKVPERIEEIDELPRNSLGKVLKPQLRARYAAQGDPP